MWERSSGRPVHRAIVWQDRRTAGACDRLKASGYEPLVSRKTGLLLDPYFSGTKIAAILDATPGARAQAERGEIAFGTVDSFLIWRLTGGRTHITDATNASRSMLFDIHKGVWDDELLSLFGVPKAILPRVTDLSGELGVTDPEVFGAAVAIRGVAGDQQAAVVGQACFEPGMMKSTYGTGCFALLNTGGEAVLSRNRLLTTIAYQLEGKRVYALEGAIFVAGAAVQWLRDGLGILPSVDQSGPLAAEADFIRTSFSSPPSSASARRIGTPTRAARCSASRGRRAERSWHVPRWKASAIRRPISSRPCEVIGAQTQRRCCASTAAWWRRIGRCNGWPTCWPRRWIARACSRRPRWERPILPVCKPGSTRRQRCSPSTGRLSAALRRPWRPPNANASSRFGATLFAGR